MPLNNIEQKVRKEFQEFADSILWSNDDGSEKYIAVGNMADWWIDKLSKAYEEGKREGEEEIFWRGYEKGVEIQIPKKYLSDEEVNETLSNY